MHDDARSPPPTHHRVFAYNNDDDDNATGVDDSEEEEKEADSKEDENEAKKVDKNGQSSYGQKSRAERVGRWGHDMFDSKAQAPKNRDYLVCHIH
jgi:hypothetical protein